MKTKHIELAGCPVTVVDTWQREGFGHGFFGRSIDVSAPREEWEGLFERVAGCQDISLALLEQVHGTEIIELLEGQIVPNKVLGDGWIVDLGVLEAQALAVGIKTADCFPVIVREKGGLKAAALHCGWKGTVEKLLPKAIQKLLELGSRLDSLEVAIGPGAQACCYEIGSDLVTLIEEVSQGLENSPKQALIHRRKARIFGNISLLLCAQAASEGVPESQIVREELCTICSNQFFSWRREKALSGRQVSYVSGFLNKENAK